MGELGMTQKALGEASGVGVSTLRRLQSGETAERGAPLLAAVSTALGWPPGHLAAIAAGGDTPIDAVSALRKEVADLKEEVAALRAELSSLRAVGG
jgi:transcriptional regulator with XRE-family HTH domain